LNDRLALAVDVSRAVRVLRDAGIDVIDTEFSDDSGAVLVRATTDQAWSALATCLTADLPLLELQRVDSVGSREDSGSAYWRLVMRIRMFDTLEELLDVPT
jgi:hypothetical protein